MPTPRGQFITLWNTAQQQEEVQIHSPTQNVTRGGVDGREQCIPQQATSAATGVAAAAAVCAWHVALTCLSIQTDLQYQPPRPLQLHTHHAA